MEYDEYIYWCCDCGVELAARNIDGFLHSPEVCPYCEGTDFMQDEVAEKNERDNRREAEKEDEDYGKKHTDSY